MQLVSRSRKYFYITTPYLIPSDDMIDSLRDAALSGVDVRIMTPGIPDKKLVYMVTRTYYKPLLEAGVRIFEYSPGFLHAKVVLVMTNTVSLALSISILDHCIYTLKTEQCTTIHTLFPI